MLEENNYNTIETIRKEYTTNLADATKKHEVIEQENISTWKF